MTFPPEIWEKIFLYVDPVVLMKFKSVCKCWNLIIDKILKENNHWYKICKREIPEDLWSTFCETLEPDKFYTDLHEKHDAALWRAMFKLWIKCKNITKYNVESKSIEPLSKYRGEECITCTATSGNTLAIGTSEGYIYFYDICNLHKGAIYVADHKEYVRSVHLWTYDTDVICVSCSVYDHISFWDIASKKLIAKTRGKLICTSYSYCFIAKYNVIVIEGPVLRTVCKFVTDNIIAIGSDNDKVYFYTEEGRYVHWNLSADKENYTCTCVQPPNIRIRRYYTFKPDIIVCIAEYGYLGFLVRGKEWKLHNVFPTLHGTPTDVLVYGNVLILGLDSGTVHIFYIEDFDKIDFNVMTSKRLILDTTAVISLNIMVHSEEYLLISYKKKIHIAKFT